ncbi:maleylpyruvate isomerase family mycothiol-dependent enzyme [Nonomuraea sp. NPDC005650]|uniref:maleylpyruvate isomerase family mycothiol-dependent enzyme n=1 Tax=Nonomuraea sp. NPDC005650 TaxID=3157045 RepID=UPI0033B5D957
MSTAHERRLPLDLRERQELCDLLAELGPDAPTLCAGWTTLDLAAHLVLREHFARWTDERMAIEKAKGLAALIDRLRGGAPLVPWRLPGIRTLMNGVEYFIHHEDVRRANGRGRRIDRPDLEALAWRMTGFTGRRAARQIRPYGLELRRPEGKPRQFGSAGGAVLSGEPTELLLYLSGRRDTAQVTLEGDADAVAALRAAHTAV